MLFERLPFLEVMVDRGMLNNLPLELKRLSAEKADVLVPMLLSDGAMLGVGALDAR